MATNNNYKEKEKEIVERLVEERVNKILEDISEEQRGFLKPFVIDKVRAEINKERKIAQTERASNARKLKEERLNTLAKIANDAVNVAEQIIVEKYGNDAFENVKDFFVKRFEDAVRFVDQDMARQRRSQNNED